MNPRLTKESLERLREINPSDIPLERETSLGDVTFSDTERASIAESVRTIAEHALNSRDNAD